MVKWLVTLFLALVILSAVMPLLGPRLRNWGVGRLPGDFRVPLRGRVYYVPLASTVLLSLLVWGIGRLL
jgi:hypothetical protein